MVALPAAQGQEIVEVHYQNVGADVGEFVEIQGPAGLDLSLYLLELYDGDPSVLGPYAVVFLSGVIPGTTGDGVVAFSIPGLQNGSPDGIALSSIMGPSIEFISYGGSFTPVQGSLSYFQRPSTNIGVSESPTTPVGYSLQKINGLWTGPAPATRGILNQGPPPPVTYIQDIQGAGVRPAIANVPVVIDGIVHADYQQLPGWTDVPLGGFFVHEDQTETDRDPRTSNGIFVITPRQYWVRTGYRVRAIGIPTEVPGLGTALAHVTSVTPLSTYEPYFDMPRPQLPASPGPSGTPYWERFEGMLVVLPWEVFVTDVSGLESAGEMVVAIDGPQTHPHQDFSPGSAHALALASLNRDSRITIDDARQDGPGIIPPTPPVYITSSRPTIRVGDKVLNFLGLVTESEGSYQLQPLHQSGFPEPTKAVSIHTGNPRPSAPAVPGRLKVASLSGVDYFTPGDPLGLCGPAGHQKPCDGPTTAEGFNRLAAKLVEAILDLDADIISVIDIENDGGGALQSLLDRINASTGRRRYASFTAGYIGQDVRTVALLYDPNIVGTAGAFARLDGTVSPAFIDSENGVALAQSFRETATGAVLTVAVADLASRTEASCDGVSNPGDPAYGVTAYPADPDGPQGRCNLTRTAGAKVLGQWLASHPTGYPSSNLLVVGDINAYPKEDAVVELEALQYSDLVNEYTSVVDGLRGSLDYAMGTPCLADRLRGAAVWHINADEPSALDYKHNHPSTRTPSHIQLDEFRSSDRDPILIGLDLGATCASDVDDDGVPNDLDVCDGSDEAGDLDDDGVCNDIDEDIDGDQVVNGEDASPATFGPTSLEFGRDELFGRFTYDGQRYSVSVPLDRITYGSNNKHRAWTKPEEYQLTTSPSLAGTDLSVNCPDLSGPGLKGFAGKKPKTGCTWASYSDSGTFQLKQRGARGPRRQPSQFNSFRLDAQLISGEIIYQGASYPVHLTLDVIDYRGVESHRGFLRAELGNNRLDVTALGQTGLRITTCDRIRSNGRNTDGIFGTRPVVTCTWKRGKGRTAGTSGQVVLQ